MNTVSCLKYPPLIRPTIKGDNTITSMKLKILCHEYDVTLDPSLLEECNDYGLMYAADTTVRIESSLSESVTKEVIMHEILEAVNFHLELGLKHRQLTAVATAMLQVMQDNIGFFRRYMLGSDPKEGHIETVERQTSEVQEGENA